MMTDQENVSQLLLASQNILVVMHIQPDGDTTGSALGLAEALRQRNKRVTVVCQDSVPSRYRFLPGAESVVTWDSVNPEDYDLGVTVDCGAESRVGPFEQFAAVRQTANIDHHVSNTRFAQVNWVDGDASATGEMVAGLLWSWDPIIPSDQAVCLYTAISTDTLSFRQINTSGHTLATVAALVHTGFELATVNERLWESQSRAESQLLGWALLNAHVSSNGKVSWLQVPRTIVKRFSAVDADVDALVHHLRSVQSVVVAIVTRELPDGRTVKVSWRGKREADVSVMAQRFGGGGHRYSAAAHVVGSLDEVTTRVVRASEVPYGG